MEPAHETTGSLQYVGSSYAQMQENSTQSNQPKPNCLQRAGSFLAGGLELFYYKLGVVVARRPIITIACVLIACLACCAGLAKFYQVDPTGPIWVDPNSLYIKHKAWVEERFPSEIRISTYIAESENNLLIPQAMLELYNLHVNVTNIAGEGYEYDQICAKFGRSESSDCSYNSILELWKFNRTVIENLTVDLILSAINDTAKSPVTNADFDPTALLGALDYGNSGEIISAKAATMTYFMQGTNASNEEYVGDDKVTDYTKDWELKFIDIGREYRGTNLTKIYTFSARSFGDEVTGGILGDVRLLSAGYIIIMIYVALILGRFNCVEMRVYLALGAVISVGLSIGVSFGLSSAFGIGYGPVQSILPFLLLGLGVDDAFVIMQAWNRLSPTERALPIEEQAGHALKHAGVSITVTSITDIVAFGIGATTVLPALKDFCIYATIGIMAVFIVQATFFQACAVLDERRRSVRRNGCCCCYAHNDDYVPNRCSRKDMQQQFFEKFYAPYLIKLPVKIVVILLSLGLLAAGIFGVINLDQEYDPNIFIPKDSYVKTYVFSYEKMFPSQSVDDGFVYIGGVNYWEDSEKVNDMSDELKTDISVKPDSVDSWLEDYIEWLSTTKCPWVESHLNNATTKFPLDERRFNMMMTPYFFMTATGRRNVANIKFNETVTFGNSTDQDDFSLADVIANSVSGDGSPNLTTPEILDLEEDFADRSLLYTRIPFEFTDMSSSAERVDAMESTRDLVKKYYTDDKSFPFSRSFQTWETDKIIQVELYRNMGLAFGCVFILTLLLIADLGACLLVSFCVLSTLVEVAGFMHLWGLSIDTVTCIQLVLAIGLAVDYSAHIGHTFMTVTGTRNERAMKTLADIGPAVFNGGFSTLLAFILLATSNSYVFDVFFRVNLLVVLLGLWNGMVLLPILLSFMGTAPYLSAQIKATQNNTQTKLKESKSAADNPAFDAQEENIMMTEKDPEKGTNSNAITIIPESSSTEDKAVVDIGESNDQVEHENKTKESPDEDKLKVSKSAADNPAFDAQEEDIMMAEKDPEKGTNSNGVTTMPDSSTTDDKAEVAIGEINDNTNSKVEHENETKESPDEDKLKVSKCAAVNPASDAEEENIMMTEKDPEKDTNSNRVTTVPDSSSTQDKAVVAIGEINDQVEHKNETKESPDEDKTKVTDTDPEKGSNSNGNSNEPDSSNEDKKDNKKVIMPTGSISSHTSADASPAAKPDKELLDED